MPSSESRPQKSKGNLAGVVVLILAAGLIDLTVVPELISGWSRSCFVSALVALIGMRRGHFTGLVFGWIAAFILASLSMSPLGFQMLRLGLLGFVAGFFIDTAAIRINWLDGLILAMLLLFEQGLGGVLGKIVYGYSLNWNILGVIFTALLFSPWIPILSRITGSKILAGAQEGRKQG
ncbi:MAG: hypothetical protein ACLFUS_17460 [Candidatus Sumerlaeia bacterium]